MTHATTVYVVVARNSKGLARGYEKSSEKFHLVLSDAQNELMAKGDLADSFVIVPSVLMSAEEFDDMQNAKRPFAERRDRKLDLHNLAFAVMANLTISNIEYGGIGLDPKRPFGNSNVSHDMLELIGAEPEDGDEFTLEQERYVDDLYHTELIPYIKATWAAFIPGEPN